MRTIFFLGLVTLLSLSCDGAAAPERDTPPTLAEAKAHYQKADRELNNAWAELKKALPEAEFAPLRDDQKAWVEYREEVAKAQAAPDLADNEKALQQSVEYLDAAAALADIRTKWIRGLVTALANNDATVTGEWSDGWGGNLRILQQDHQLRFSINVVRGRSSAQGELSGRAVWNEPLGWYSDKGLDPNKTDETNLAFVLRRGKLELIGANTQEYHGAQAYFDGTYVKVAPLDAATKKELKLMSPSGK